MTRRRPQCTTMEGAEARPSRVADKNKTPVVKIGGAPCAFSCTPRACAPSVVRELGIHAVLVHGGGPQTSELSKKLGLQPRIYEGRRVTDAAALEVAILTMNGAVNTNVLSACRAVGLQAVGVSGLDAGLIRARRRAPRTVMVEGEPQMVDFGFVGDVESVDVTLLRSLLASGYLPVVSPLSADDQGNVLNINADTVAATLARALGAEKLVFVTDVPGVLEDKSDRSSDRLVDRPARPEGSSTAAPSRRACCEGQRDPHGARERVNRVRDRRAARAS